MSTRIRVSLRIHLYTICWNERRLLPYFLRHYEQFCERLVICDNGSDDGSQEIVASHPLCELRHVDSGGEFHEGTVLQVKGQMWKESRETADWVICCDVDEFLHHPQLVDFLADCRAQGITIPAPTGWHMVSGSFPVGNGQIYDEVQTGFSDGFYNKRIVFNPSAIQEINYSPGCHFARPDGNIYELADPALKMLHFKYLGPEYVSSRYAALAQRLSEFNRSHGFGRQYLGSPQELAAQFSDLQLRSQKVPLS